MPAKKMIDRGMRRQGPIAVLFELLGMEVLNVFAVLKPLVFWPMVAGSAAVIRGFWPDCNYVIGFFAIVTVLITWFIWHLTYDKEKIASFHAMFSVVLVSALMAAIDVVGWTRFTIFAMLFGVFMICASWSMRAVIKNHERVEGTQANNIFAVGGMEGATAKVINPDTGRIVKGSVVAKPATLFATLKARKETAAIPVITDLAIKPTGKQRPDSAKPAKQLAIAMNPGDTIEDLNNRKKSIESAAQVPPGTLIITPNLDDASRARGIVSDPRSIRKPISYPGPSWIGGSIADPISTGLYQDGTEVEWLLPDLQIQIMGMTGSGKSLGGAWGTLAEVITRHDVFVWGVDITKGQQTLGPLADSLHRLETEPIGAMNLLTDVNTLIKPRTNYLTTKGLGKWEPDSGLQYGIIWLEEVPDILDAVGKTGVDLWIKSVKAARSAGISIVWSLQKSVATQVPTLARGQAAKWCFGVSEKRDGQFGLSSRQKDKDTGGCTPELWANRQPGTAYFDAPSIDDDHVMMANRSWFWGKDDSLIRAHAANYPASDRPYDALTASVVMGGSVIVPETTPVVTGTVVAVPAATEPKVPTKRLMDPSKARALMREWMLKQVGLVRVADWKDTLDSTGYGRSWGYKVLEEMKADGLVTKHTDENGIAWSVKDKMPA